jgi:EAL domain-containing protein (putative c-di-GMP-specific phosphodiesterase class I)
MTSGAHGAAIVRAVAALASGLGMETTAEGVETREQLDLVRTEGCTEAQGFFFSFPRPASELECLSCSPDGTAEARSLARRAGR